MAHLTGAILSQATTEELALRTLLDAAKTALSIKIVVRESARRQDDEIVEEVVRAALLDLSGNDTPPAGNDPSDLKPNLGGGDGQQGTPRPGGRPTYGSQPSFGTPNPGAITAGGTLYYGDEAQKTAAGRPRGDRGSQAFANDYPALAERLFQKREATPADLEEALTEIAANPLEILGQMASFFDRSDLRALARRLALELIVREAWRKVGRRSGRGKLTSLPYGGEATELDLERTVETLIGKPRPADSDIFIWERRQRQRAYALLLDISGSMKGAKIFYAAMALAAVAVRVQHNPFAVIAFWRDAALLKQLHEAADLEPLLNKLLSLSGRGLTNLELALQAGLEELDRATTQERVGILFSDGLQTAGQPAGPLAAAYPTLHVVGTGDSDESIASCRHLAQLGQGRCAIVSEVGGITQAVNLCLAN
jgi:Mg-chelatase subunit ChlD